MFGMLLELLVLSIGFILFLIFLAVFFGFIFISALISLLRDKV